MKFRISKHLADKELSAEERRGVLEDLFVFGKENQGPFQFRCSRISCGKLDWKWEFTQYDANRGSQPDNAEKSPAHVSKSLKEAL